MALPAQQSLREPRRAALASVERVVLHFAHVDSTALDFGVDSAQLRTAVEEQLGEAGLRVVQPTGRAVGPATPVLVLEVRVPQLVAPPGVDFAGMVMLALRAPPADTGAAPSPIWTAPTATTRSPSLHQIAERIPGLVRTQVDRFIKAVITARDRRS